MDIELKKEFIDHLSRFLTENKKEKINTVIKDRTRHIAVVLEDVFQPHNASAVVRSAECFGIQDLHIVEKRNVFESLVGIDKGSSKWIDFYKYKDTTSCIKTLKNNGYKIVATTPHKKSCLLSDLNIDNKTALLFGTEAVGLSQEAIELADKFVTIPMFGFTESFNVSVSVAICLYDLGQRLRKSSLDWRLTEKEMFDIQLDWMRKVVVGADIIEKNFLENKRS